MKTMARIPAALNLIERISKNLDGVFWISPRLAPEQTTDFYGFLYSHVSLKSLSFALSPNRR
jgi:hypothetical protein